MSHILPVTFIALLVYILMRQPYSFYDNTLLQDTILNSGHIPLFGLLAIYLLTLSRRHLSVNINKPHLHYMLALTASLLLGAGTEILQSLTASRHAEISDFYFDFIGGFSFLLLIALFDPDLQNSFFQKNNAIRLLFALLAISSWLPGILPVYWVIKHQQLRTAYFPVLILPGTLPTDFFTLKNSRVILTKLPAPYPHKPALKWTTGMQTSWPFIRIAYPRKDWSTFNTLELDIYSPSSVTVRLTLRVDDQYFDHDRRHRQFKTFPLKQGLNHVSLDLQPSNKHNRLDMTKIRHIWLALPEPQQAHTLYITYLGLKQSVSPQLSDNQK